jgi:hypothetical protein
MFCPYEEEFGSQWWFERLIFGDFLNTKCRLIFVAQGRNPCPREEWKGERHFLFKYRQKSAQKS